MAASRLFCAFRVGDDLFGLDVSRVREVLLPRPITRVTLASRAIRGLINLRGEIVMAIDLRECLGRPPVVSDAELMNIVALTPDGPISLLVDEARDVCEVFDDSFEPAPPHLKGAARDLIRGTYDVAGNLLFALDLDALLRLIDTEAVPASV